MNRVVVKILIPFFVLGVVFAFWEFLQSNTVYAHDYCHDDDHCYCVQQPGQVGCDGPSGSIRCLSPNFCNSSCFLPGTQISMADGTTKNIEDVKVGDAVMSFDEDRNLVSKKVLELESPIREGYYEVFLANGTVLKVTSEHPMFFRNTIYSGWGAIDPSETYRQDKMRVQKIKVGNELLQSDNNWTKILSMIYVPGEVQTYNLKSIEDTKTFFAEGIYVHNKNHDTCNPSCGSPYCGQGDGCGGSCGSSSDSWSSCSTCSPTPGPGTCTRTNPCRGSRTDNCCTVSSPAGGMSLISPSTGTEHITSPTTFNWSSVGSWGYGCSNNNTYTVLTTKITPGSTSCPAQGAGYSSICSVAGTENGCTAVVNTGSTYCWYVTASNGSITKNSAETSRFNTKSDVIGYAWDSAGDCSSDKASNEFIPGSVTSPLGGSPTPTVSGASGTWDPGSFSGYSYKVPNAPLGNAVACMPLIPAGSSAFKYRLTCLDSSVSGVISGNCASINVNSDPKRADLGYQLVSAGWLTTLSGDVYGGGGGTSISVGIPNVVLGGFSDFLVKGFGTVFGNDDLSVKTVSGTNRYSEDNNRFAKFIRNDSNWPTGYNFISPANALDISNLDNLDPEKVYKIDGSDLNNILDSPYNYNFSKDGVVVIYVDGDIEFNATFSASSDEKRIIFVVDGAVFVSSDLGTLVVSPTDAPSLMAGVISKEEIIFETVGDIDGDDISDDISVTIEGPLVSQAGIRFDRDRGYSNDYPSEVIVYNPIYLKALAKQAMDNDVTNYTGLMTMDVIWSTVMPSGL